MKNTELPVSICLNNIAYYDQYNNLNKETTLVAFFGSEDNYILIDMPYSEFHALVKAAL